MKKRKASSKRKHGLNPELLDDLIRQKKRYENYFEGIEKNGTMDNSALSAYMGILKLLIELDLKEGPASPEELKQIAKEILENEYGVRRG